MEFYRYELRNYASLDEFGDVAGHHTSVNLSTYHLIKETPKGYWIGFGGPFISWKSDWKKWVSKTSRKRFAYPTKEEALHGFIKRTERRKKILQSQVHDCSMALHIAQNKLKKEANDV